MKKLYMIMSAAALILGGCNYNEYNLDGFEDEFGDGASHSDVQSIEYTLADADYTSIANNTTNKALAEANGTTDVLAAIGSNKYFVDKEDAKQFLPAFINSSYSWVDNNSTATITYRTAVDMPEELAALNAVKEYELTDDDYKAVWGSDEDYTSALTPATINKLTSVIPTDSLEAGEYIAVSYKYSASEPTFKKDDEGDNGESKVVYVYKPVDAPADADGKYLLIANKEGKNYAFTALAESYNYGYPAGTEVTIADGVIDAESVDDTLVLTIKNVSGDKYTIQDYLGRYYYQSGTYNSFNVSATYDESYAFTFSTNGGAVFTNASGYWIQHGQGTYTTWGAYNSEKGSNPTIYQLVAIGGEGDDDNSGKVAPTYQPVTAPVSDDDKYILVANKDGKNYAFTALAADKTYGYPAGTEVTIADGVIDAESVAETLVLTIKKSGDKYTIQDYLGRYYYQSGTYKSFNVSATYDDAYAYTFSNSNGAAIFTSANGYWIQHGEGTYTTWGAYTTQSGSNPTLYRLVDGETKTAAYAAPATRAVAVTSEQKYAVYKYDGTSFAAADVAVVQPADYKAMGQSYDNLTDPAQDTYLPKYLTQALPYASAGESVYVSFILRKDNANKWATDEYTFDGASWSKANYFTEKTEQFRKTNGAWAVDPTLEINYLTAGTDEFKAFCQYCANWVYDNIDVALGAPARDNAGDILSTDKITISGELPAGTFFVSSYGNNEWFAGSYAYYGEMNWRATSNNGSARDSYENALNAIKEKGLDIDLNIDPDIFSKSDADIELAVVAAMMKNSAVVFQNVLHYMYPDVTPEQYTKAVVNVYNYFDKATTGVRAGVYSFTFTVTGTGEFEYVEDSIQLL